MHEELLIQSSMAMLSDMESVIYSFREMGTSREDAEIEIERVISDRKDMWEERGFDMEADAGQRRNLFNMLWPKEKD